MAATPGNIGGLARPRLLLFSTSADHPHRDPVCATLAWLAAAEGALFECYFDSTHTGVHFGGGHPGWHTSGDLRGSTVTGGRHLETARLLANHFRCELISLGPSLLGELLQGPGIELRCRANDVAELYREVFSSSDCPWPSTLLVVGDGGRPQGVPLTSYAFPEVVGRKALAIADNDRAALTALAPGMSVVTLWTDAAHTTTDEPGLCATPLGPVPDEDSVAAQTAWMAERWCQDGDTFVLGDPELVGRWTPTAVRRRWQPLYGIPQADVIHRMAPAIAQRPLVYGRQHHDQDFFLLSRLGTGLQVVDPGSPPFPVVSEVNTSWPSASIDPDDPSDDQLRQWADDNRVLVSVLFWTGMIRELQNLFPLTDILSITGLRAGLVVTTESFRYAAGTPLELVNVPREAGGLSPMIELLLTDTGSGVLVAADAPNEQFASALKASVADLAELLGTSASVPRGWWAHMDAPLVPGRTPRVSRFPDRPRLRIRYQPRNLELLPPPASVDGPTHRSGRELLRDSRLGKFFAPLRPYEAQRPGLPSTGVLTAVRAAGFDYGITKAAAGPVPKVFRGPDGLTVFNQTAGRWDGWSPFHTINALADLERSEHRLNASRRPGWLVGAIDTCLWAFTGPVWQRGGDLHEICAWAARGGSDGRLINATPNTIARYARLLAERGLVETVVTRDSA